ncbi:unnamed protein product [Natator depressus]
MMYGHLVMLFGLCNTPATFQYFINDIFRNMVDQFVIIYLDDILVVSESQAFHNHYVRIVLERLHQNKLFTKLEVSLKTQWNSWNISSHLRDLPWSHARWRQYPTGLHPRTYMGCRDSWDLPVSTGDLLKDSLA